MNRRRLTWIALTALGVLAVSATLWSVFGPDQIVLSATQLQARINMALPREFRGVTVEQAVIAVADGQVALRVETRAAVFGRAFRAVVLARGVPRFAAEYSALFFDATDVKVTDFVVTDQNVAERSGLLSTAFREGAEAAAGKAIAAGIRVYLAERPVYRFKEDLKGIVLKAAVSDIKTQGDAIVVTVSLVRLTQMVAINLAVLLIIMFLIVQLIRRPSWGLSVFDTALNATGS
jgi:hypothetical protein